MSTMIDRRSFMRAAAISTAAAGFAALGLADQAHADEALLETLPAPEPDPASSYGVDSNINMSTIDRWLGRPDVAYRDARMLIDPSDKAASVSNGISATIAGFKIVPYTSLAPLSAPYSSDTTLYRLEWDAEGNIISATPNFEESDLILNDLFPKDKAIFVMCAAGGYAAMTKALLVFLGWDESLLYNIGGFSSYTGDNTIEFKVDSGDADGTVYYATWRADYAYIDVDLLHPIDIAEATGSEPEESSVPEYTLRFGELQSVVVNEIDGKTVMVIKAKITSSYSNKATIDQNYYNVVDLIQNQGCDIYDEIQYWAVADMSNGSESKVISFTVDKNLIDRIAAGTVVDNQLGDYVSDLWIHQSLRD